MTNSITYANIAREAGVCKATVAKVLSGGENNIRVRPETAARIQGVAKRLNYRPNMNARALTGKSCQLLGAIIDTGAPPSCYEALGAACAAAAESGYRVLVYEVHDSVPDVIRHYGELAQYGVDGVICFAHDYPDQREVFQARFRQCGHMVVSNPCPDAGLSGAGVDPEGATRTALAHFIRGGRRRAAAVYYESRYWTIQQRTRLYSRLCGELDIPLRRWTPPAVILQAADAPPIIDACVEEFILRERIDALFAPNDFFAAWLLAALKRRGIRVPDDVAVVGWDNDEVSGALDPPLASIDPHFDRQGRRLVELLLARMAEKSNATATADIEADFVWRASAGEPVQT